jgi:hypothetical protein
MTNMQDSHFLSSVLLDQRVVCTLLYLYVAVAQAVSWLPFTTDAQFQSQTSPCRIFGGQSDIATGFSPSTAVFPCHYHSTNVPFFHLFITGTIVIVVEIDSFVN